MQQGEKIGGYTAEKPLGTGRFATVWKVKKDSGALVAVKVYRAGRTNAEYWRNEVKILNLLAERKAAEKITVPIITYFGTFAVVRFDDLLEPCLHPCIEFGLAGDSVSRLIKHCATEYDAGVPVECAKKIIRDCFRGLEFLHGAGIIHTDIKPSNLLLDRPIESINGLNFTALIADLGSSTTTDKLFAQHVGTDEYIAPELILEKPYTFAIDIWSMFVTAFELLTGDLLFDIYRETGISYGDDVDEEALVDSDSSADCVEDCGSEGDMREDNSGAEPMSEDESSGSDNPERLAMIAYRHLLLMEKVLGPPGKQFTKSARKYYNARGKLKNNPVIVHKPISELLRDNYDIALDQCRAIETFLLQGLKYSPVERCSATAALCSQWLL
jgi:serine/threonine protein kinase